MLGKGAYQGRWREQCLFAFIVPTQLIFYYKQQPQTIPVACGYYVLPQRFNGEARVNSQLLTLDEIQENNNYFMWAHYCKPPRKIMGHIEMDFTDCNIEAYGLHIFPEYPTLLNHDMIPFNVMHSRRIQQLQSLCGDGYQHHLWHS